MANDYFNNAPGGMYNGYQNPYNPAGAPFSYPGVNGYQPRTYGPYAPPIAQQTANLNAQPVQQQNVANVNWIYVPNLEAAKNVSIMPSQTLYIMNQNKNEFYLKTSNEMGVSSLKVCPFSVFDASEYEQKAQIEQAQTVAGEFVGRDEFNNFAQNVSQQFAAIQQGMSQQIPQTVQPVVMQQPVPVVQQAPAIVQPEEPVNIPPVTKGRKNKE